MFLANDKFSVSVIYSNSIIFSVSSRPVGNVWKFPNLPTAIILGNFELYSRLPSKCLDEFKIISCEMSLNSQTSDIKYGKLFKKIT